jgi:hypothetical protein
MRVSIAGAGDESECSRGLVGGHVENEDDLAGTGAPVLPRDMLYELGVVAETRLLALQGGQLLLHGGILALESRTPGSKHPAVPYAGLYHGDTGDDYDDHRGPEDNV